MQFAEISEKAKSAAERAGINEAKQYILFQWIRARKPALYGISVPLASFDFASVEPAVEELNRDYPGTTFVIAGSKSALQI